MRDLNSKEVAVEYVWRHRGVVGVAVVGFSAANNGVVDIGDLDVGDVDAVTSVVDTFTRLLIDGEVLTWKTARIANQKYDAPAPHEHRCLTSTKDQGPLTIGHWVTCFPCTLTLWTSDKSLLACRAHERRAHRCLNPRMHYVHQRKLPSTAEPPSNLPNSNI